MNSENNFEKYQFGLEKKKKKEREEFYMLIKLPNVPQVSIIVYGIHVWVFVCMFVYNCLSILDHDERQTN